MKFVHEGQLKRIFLDKECEYFLDFPLLFFHDFSAAGKMSAPGKRGLWFDSSKDSYEWTRWLRSLSFP